MMAGPSSSRRNARTRSTDRVISVRGRISTGKSGQVHLRPRPNQPVGVVEHHHPTLLQPPAELDGRVEAVAFGPAQVGVVAEEDHVEVVQPLRGPAGAAGPQLLHVIDRRLQPFPLGPGQRPPDMGAVMRQVFDRHEGDVVAPPVGGIGQMRGGVGRPLRPDAVHHEADAHARCAERRRSIQSRRRPCPPFRRAAANLDDLK